MVFVVVCLFRSFSGPVLFFYSASFSDLQSFPTIILLPHLITNRILINHHHLRHHLEHPMVHRGYYLWLSYTLQDRWMISARLKLHLNIVIITIIFNFFIIFILLSLVISFTFYFFLFLRFLFFAGHYKI